MPKDASLSDSYKSDRCFFFQCGAGARIEWILSFTSLLTWRNSFVSSQWEPWKFYQKKVFPNDFAGEKKAPLWRHVSEAYARRGFFLQKWDLEDWFHDVVALGALPVAGREAVWGANWEPPSNLLVPYPRKLLGVSGSPLKFAPMKPRDVVLSAGWALNRS